MLRQMVLRFLLLYSRLPYFPGKWVISAELLQSTGISDYRGIVKRGPFRFRLDCATNETDRYLAFVGAYEVHELRIAATLIAKGGCVLDIGGNIGYHALWFGRFVGSGGEVHSLEPFPETFARLQEHIEWNGMPWVHAWRVAASDENAQLKGIRDRGMQASHLAGREDGGAEGVLLQGVRTDDFVRERIRGKISFIKIDVEGAELRVLEGASEVIRRDRPHMMIEVNPIALRRQGTSPTRLLDLLDAAGYTTEVPTRRGAVPVKFGSGEESVNASVARLAAMRGRASLNIFARPSH